jgi:preprotein translocase subunit SecB
MKMQLLGMHLLEGAFRHTADPFAATKSEAKSNTEAQPAAEIKVELAKGDQPNTYLAILRVRIEPPANYSVSVAYAASMLMDPEGEAVPDNLDQQIMVTGATLAFPYCRELVSNLTARGRFGPVWLNPVNFANVILQPKEGQVALAK